MSDYLKYLPLNDELYEFARSHRSGIHDPILTALREETATLGDDARMQISEEQGQFLYLLAQLIGTRRAIEVGTFTGCSALCVARALPPDGKLLCLDVDEEWTSIASKYWEQAGVADKVELRIGPAIESLEKLDPDTFFDLAFIDADKTEYNSYYELVLPHIRPNGLILFDNMLWGGRVLEGISDHENAKAIRELNAKLATDSRIECVLLPIADGIQFCRKR